VRKVEATLDEMECRVEAFEGHVDIGTVTLACALGYLGFRYADLDWRKRCPRVASWYAVFSERESMLRTPPQA